MASRSRLSPTQWTDERHALQERVRPLVEDRLKRAGAAKWHPVYDFLFEYYPYRPAHLMRYSPGCGVLLEGAGESDLDWPDAFTHCENGCIIPAQTFPAHRVPFLQWVYRYLTKIAERTPLFGCLGMHEWAMVYQSEARRYPNIPLRLPDAEVAKVVETIELRCTHFDAFRFFTAPARPLNRSQLSREQTEHFDQRGCVHVTMDLYKYAHKIAPWCSSDLVTESFLLASSAREVDMRASPYDLTGFGFEPVTIETKNGQEEYIHLQRQLAERATPIRLRLIEEYRYLLEERAEINSRQNLSSQNNSLLLTSQ